ncbi:MAG: ferritin family protein [Nitrospirae bacterium]|nr:ferritin family protein [Nitrospirota bacterium]
MRNQNRLHTLVTHIMYITASTSLLLISLAMIGAGGWDVWLAFHSSTEAVPRMLDAIGLIVVAVAVFDVSKYLIEEEVLRNRELRSSAEARKTLTKFLVIVTIAAYLEALVFIFSAATQEMAQIIYPTLLLAVASLGVVCLGAFQRLSAHAENSTETSALTPAKTIKSALLSEIKSRAFYRLAADLTNRDDSRALFLDLAALEVGHARELAERASRPPLNLDFDPFAYVSKWEKQISGTLAPQDEKTVREGDPRAVLKLAKRREAEARDNYRELAQEADDPLMRAFCEELSRTEQAHLEGLRRLEAHLGTADAAPPAA